jgi:hypothetical protein
MAQHSTKLLSQHISSLLTKDVALYIQWRPAQHFTKRYTK